LLASSSGKLIVFQQIIAISERGINLKDRREHWIDMSVEKSNQDSGSLTDMLLQILPHIGTVNLDRNTSTLKDLGVTDTRKFQDLRRLDASG
jgi:hypothetical protein